MSKPIAKVQRESEIVLLDEDLFNERYEEYRENTIELDKIEPMSKDTYLRDIIQHCKDCYDELEEFGLGITTLDFHIKYRF